MKLHIMSDLHREFGGGFVLPETDADVIILAGDTDIGTRGVEWAIESTDKPVVYIIGNHEYYRGKYPELIQTLKDIAKGTNVVVLENDTFTLRGVNILGCTLWADCNLHGTPELSMRTIAEGMNDYRLIRVPPEYRRLRPADTVARCHRSIKWLRETIVKYDDPDKCVVVTHHAPSPQSIAERYKLHEDHNNPAYASDFGDDILKMKPKYWIHGHMHLPARYRIGGTEIVSNPLGYPHEANYRFNPELILEV